MSAKERIAVIKLGGSAMIDQDGVNSPEATTLLTQVLPALEHFRHKVFVIGGGARVRKQQAAQPLASDEEKDLIGILTLEEHANQLSEIVKNLGHSVADIPRSPSALKKLVNNLQDEIVIVSGLQPGQSTDTGAIYAAELFRRRAHEAWVVILSNVLTIFTADPRKDATAQPIRKANVQRLVEAGILLRGKSEWKPGLSIPIDPVAVDMLCQNPVEKLFFTDAQNIPDTQKFLADQPTSNGTSLVSDQIETEYYSTIS